MRNSVRKRMREVDVEEIMRMKEYFKMKDKDIAALLGVHPTQLSTYKRCGKIPADRFYALRDALLLNIEEEAREKREFIMNGIMD